MSKIGQKKRIVGKKMEQNRPLSKVFATFVNILSGIISAILILIVTGSSILRFCLIRQLLGKLCNFSMCTAQNLVYYVGIMLEM